MGPNAATSYFEQHLCPDLRSQGPSERDTRGTPNLLSPTTASDVSCSMSSDCLAPEPLPVTSYIINSPVSERGTTTQSCFCGHDLPNHGGPTPELVPIDPSIPTPPSPEQPFSLRLPPFETLGIATRNSSKSCLALQHALPGSTNPLSTSSKPGICHTPILVASPFQLPVLTPPEENSAFKWDSGMIESSQVGGNDPPLPSAAPQTLESTEAQSSHPTPPGRPSPSISAPVETSTDWLEPAIRQITSIIESAEAGGSELKILSHALPSPSTQGHSFQRITEHLRTQLPTRSLVWISLLHAVPGRFSLEDLPRSPPDTPGQPLTNESEDYFVTQVISNAVPAYDYEGAGSPTSTRDQLLTAPGSVNLTIVERYIPPISSNEFRDLFSIIKPSLLVDRMVEISSRHGMLLFIYPTKPGADTFCNAYLGPLLDPLLRAMAVVNDFPSDVSQAVGRMASASHLFDFETMESRIKQLCNDLTEKRSPETRKRLLGDDDAQFSLVYAEKRQVALERQVWADWWIKQEKTRIRGVFERQQNTARFFKGESQQRPSHFVQEIFDGVLNREYTERGPMSKIEVGVFIIMRNRRD